ncbi:hypothetical protein [Sphingomicrobium flavum]|uniref:hypothetical protein n=1 Tax=Sphingomicrobium flavum TaxID=1229164 RepID=UPI0021ADCFE3|nr:hypothetical protein [Sphingomicrobium flavum]
MRKILMTAAAFGIAAAGVTAAPAAAEAQRYGGYGYEQPRYDSRYDNRYDRRYDQRYFAWSRQQQQRLNQRVAEMRRDIRHFDRIDAISGKEARKLDKKARKVQQRIYAWGRNGLDRREIGTIRQDIRSLRYSIQRDLRDGRHTRYGYGYQGRDRWDRDDDYYEERRERRYERRRDRRDDD